MSVVSCSYASLVVKENLNLNSFYLENIFMWIYFKENYIIMLNAVETNIVDLIE